MSTKDPKGYYAILQIPVTASAAEIKSAYRRRAMELHPDRSTSSKSTVDFQLLTEAYNVLSDPSIRAQYDTVSVETKSRNTAAETPPEPIVCSACGKVTAQPRYAIFYEIKSFIFTTIRTPIQGIFCSACAEKKALSATAITWLFGWWGFPWGFIYSIHAIFTNLLGGTRPKNINARLAAYQAWVFAVLGKLEIARAIALDALLIARKIKPEKVTAKLRQALGHAVDHDGSRLVKEIEELLAALGNGGTITHLKDSWSLFRHRTFYVQGLIGLTVITFVWGAIHNVKPGSSPSASKPYIADFGPVPAPKASYIRPATAPNGELWPSIADYVEGYPLKFMNGLSTVTVDNSQHDSDVFVKLVSIDGRESFPIRTFFIPAYGSFTLNSVTVGRYDIRYRDLSNGRLSRSEAFTLEEISTEDGTQYSNVTMTLYKVAHGNMQIYELSEIEF